MKHATIVIAALLLLACGGTAPSAEEPEGWTPDPETEQAERERQAIMDAEPESPYRVQRVRAFRANEHCGQGPYRIRLDALGVRHGERIDVSACASQDIAGRYRLTSEQEPWITDDVGRAFGHRRDNEQCRANEAELVTRAESGGETPRSERGGPTTGTARGEAGSSADTPSEVDPVALEELSGFEECPEGQFRVPVMSNRSFETASGTPLDAGADLTIELWSTAPNFMERVTFLVRQSGVEDMTDAQWSEHQAAYRQWSEGYRAFVEGEVASGRSHWVEPVDTGEHGPPPAPRTETPPPRPSQNAEWIPGSWHYDSRWAWVEGWWRVSQADVDAELTVHAPTAPPARREEARAQETKPAPNAVWADGHWQWDGNAYLWVAGAWRLPPSARHRWRAPRWQARGTGAVFVPGRWSVRVGR